MSKKISLKSFKKIISIQSLSFLIIFILGTSLGFFGNNLLIKSKSTKQIGLVNNEPILIENLNALLKDRFGKNSGTFDSLQPKSQEIIFNDAANIRMYALEAKKIKLDKKPDFEDRIAFYKEKLLKEQYLEHISSQTITDDQMQAKYQEMVDDIKGKFTLNYSQIVTTSKANADLIIKKLNTRRYQNSFAKLAKKYSVDVESAARGGTMKNIGEADIDPIIANIIKNLSSGSHSQAFQVKNQWYIVKKESAVPLVPLPFDNVKEVVKNAIIADRTKEATSKAKAANEIVYFGLK